MKKLLRNHPYILGFGILQIFFSAPGQTFLIALFVGPIFNEMGISLSLFATLYSAATLSAALLLNPAGRLLDKYRVQGIVKVVTVSMAIGCLALASANNLITIFIGFFVLRLIGQGVFGLTASTLMVKKFHINRGKALGIISLGFPLSEAVYPFLVLFLLSVFGWRMSYVIFGLSNVLIMLPLQLYLLKRANIQHGEFLPGEVEVNPQRLRGNPEDRKIRSHKNFTLRDVLKDFKFYLLLIASCLPPMVVTGLFFHQSGLFSANQWAMSLAASGLMTYAICKAVSSLYIGFIVDKYGPLPPFVLLILMLGGGTYVAGLGGPTVIIFIYFILIGAALGLSSPVTNVVWPHFYGAKYIGSIKGMVATFRNGVTAFGPLPIAMAMDMGISINVILKWIAVCILLMASLPMIVWRMDKYEQSDG